jgi:hypothetical protein
MSLASLNNPGLVASAGAAALAILPVFEELVAAGGISWSKLKIANASVFLVQVIAVSIPGRLDDQVARAIQEESDPQNAKGDGATEQGKSLAPVSGRTLVAPSGWAFAIWGPIFIGEFVFVASQAMVSSDDALVPILSKVSVPFIFAHIFQTLWTAAFRPKYSGNLMYISCGMLSATAYSLSKAHAAFASASSMYNFGTYLKLFAPISMHFGWTTAASLVNLNGAFSMKELASSRNIALLGHLSVIAATAIGTGVTITRSAPVFGGVVTWALLSVADGMKKRLDNAKIKGNDENASNLLGAETQRKLSLAGAVITGIIVTVTTVKIIS